MLRRMLATALVVGAMGQGIHAAPELLLQGLKNPESVVIAFGGKVLVSEIGEFDKDGDGTITATEIEIVLAALGTNLTHNKITMMIEA